MKRSFIFKTSIMILIVILTTIGLFACGVPENNYTYGSFQLENTLSYEINYEGQGMRYNGVFESLPFTYAESYGNQNVDLVDINALDKNYEIKYVTRHIDDIENPVVASKWIYFYSIHQAAYGDNPADKPIKLRKTYVIDPGSDQYCLENLSIFNEYYFSEKYNYSLGSIKRNILSLLLLKYTNDFSFAAPYQSLEISRLSEIYKDIEREFLDLGITWEIAVAALCRYQYIDFAERPGRLYLSNGMKLNVVGYFETEADKLLSACVTEDYEWQIVMEQAHNTKIYSLNGNILK